MSTYSSSHETEPESCTSSSTAITTAVESLIILHKITSEDLPEQGSIGIDVDKSPYLGRGAGAMHLLDRNDQVRK